MVHLIGLLGKRRAKSENKKVAPGRMAARGIFLKNGDCDYFV